MLYRTQQVAKATIAKVKSVQGEVASQAASLWAHADASTAHAVEVLSGCVQEVVMHSEAQASRVAKMVTRQLEGEIQAVVASATMNANINVRTMVEGMRREVQAQIEQNRVKAQRRDEETQQMVNKIFAGLEQLTKQLNEFRPASEANVGGVQKQVSEQFEQRLNL